MHDRPRTKASATGRKCPVLTVLLVAAVGACSPVEPDDGLLEVSGVVLVDDRPAGLGEVAIFMRTPVGYDSVASTDEDGRYTFFTPESPGACRQPIVALVLDSPFPRESEPVEIHPPSPCTGEVQSPDLVVPGVDYEMKSFRFTGLITRGTLPATATIVVVVESPLWGPHVVASTAATGHYVVEGSVPDYYCDDLVFRTQPPNALFAPNCGEDTFDLQLSG